MTTKRRPAGPDRETIERKQLTIDLNEQAHARLMEFVRTMGGHGTKKTVMSRLVQWFIRQPDWVKQIIMGWVPAGKEHEYATALRGYADDLERIAASDTVPSNAKVDKHFIDELEPDDESPPPPPPHDPKGRRPKK